MAGAQSALPRVAFADAEGEVQKAEEGWILLQWQPDGKLPEGAVYELQEAPGEDFSTAKQRYRGRDTASLRSGLAEGLYAFRVRAVDGEAAGPWSEPLQVRVEFVSDALVAGLLAAGSVVFLITVGTILTGHARVRRTER